MKLCTAQLPMKISGSKKVCMKLSCFEFFMHETFCTEIKCNIGNISTLAIFCHFRLAYCRTISGEITGYIFPCMKWESKQSSFVGHRDVSGDLLHLFYIKADTMLCEGKCHPGQPTLDDAYAGLPHTNLMCEHTRSQVYAWRHELAIKLLFFFIREIFTFNYESIRHRLTSCTIDVRLNIRCPLYVFYHNKA